MHAQCHRRMRIPRCDARLPIARVGSLHPFYPPGWMLVARLDFTCQLRFECFPLAQEPAQYGIDVALGGPTLDEPAGFHRFIDDGVVVVALRFQRIERAPE